MSEDRMTEATEIPIEDQVCECGHWYDEHSPAADGESACCEGCYQAIAPQGSYGTDEDLKDEFGFTHEHEFKFSAENSTPEAIADRGGDPESWPKHVKDHFEREAVATIPIVVGESYTFFSTLQGIDGSGIYPALYTGRTCVVIREAEDYDREDAGERMWHVRFEDGAETDVWEGEINNWFRDTGQYHGAFAVEVRPTDRPADFKFNHPRERA